MTDCTFTVTGDYNNLISESAGATITTVEAAATTTPSSETIIIYREAETESVPQIINSLENTFVKTITAYDFGFSPVSIAIPSPLAGDISLVASSGMHNMMSYATNVSGEPLFYTGMVAPEGHLFLDGEEVKLSQELNLTLLDKNCSYPYYCAPHQSMIGTLRPLGGDDFSSNKVYVFGGIGHGYVYYLKLDASNILTIWEKPNFKGTLDDSDIFGADASLSIISTWADSSNVLQAADDGSSFTWDASYQIYAKMMPEINGKVNTNTMGRTSAAFVAYNADINDLYVEIYQPITDVMGMWKGLTFKWRTTETI